MESVYPVNLENMDLIAEQLIALSFLIVWALVAVWIGVRRRFFADPGYPFRWGTGAPPIGFWSVLLGFLIYFGAQVLIAPLFFTTLDGSLPEKLGWAQFGTLLVASGALVLFAALTKLRFVWGKFSLRTVFFGLVGWLIAYPVATAIGQIISLVITVVVGPIKEEQAVIEQIQQFLDFPLLLAFTAFTVVILVPMAEEILFRGLLQSWLRRSFSKWGAICASSAIFALFHFALSQGLANIEILALLFILGGFLGYIYERQQSLWAPIALHALFNGLTLIALVVAT